MTTSLLKNKLTEAIAGINDKLLLEALYTIVNRAENKDYELSKEDLLVIEARRKAFKSGKAKGITVIEMEKRFSKKFKG